MTKVMWSSSEHHVHLDPYIVWLPMGLCGVSSDFTERLIEYLLGKWTMFPASTLALLDCHSNVLLLQTRRSIDRGHSVLVSSKSCRQDSGADAGGNGVSYESLI
jgi:hypothetical protein